VLKDPNRLVAKDMSGRVQVLAYKIEPNRLLYGICDGSDCIDADSELNVDCRVDLVIGTIFFPSLFSGA